MDDERLSKIESDKQNAINQSNSFYNNMLQDNQNLYDQKMDYSNTYEKTQNDVLDRQLAYQEGLIEQQKDKAKENFQTESKKALNDYTALINPYGYQAESMVSNGLLNSGMSETFKLGGFNAYQNRLASANKVMQDAFVAYDNEINEARLNNDVQKAQNALEKLQMQIEFADSYYTNKSNIGQNQLSNNQALDSEYYGRYQNVVNQINYEKEQAEAIRQFNEQMAYQREQAAQAQANWEKEYALALQEANKSSGGSGGSYSLSGVPLETSPSSGTGIDLWTGSVAGSITKQLNSTPNVSASTGTVKKAMDIQLSSNTAQKFFNNLNSSYSEDELTKVLTDGVNKGKISLQDLYKITNAYK